jgi:hypothetical protein
MGRTVITAITQSYRLLLLLILIICGVSPWPAFGESVLPQLVPCFEKSMPGISTLPASVPIILAIGHEFRNGDECEPVTVTLTWENYYDRQDGYTHYDLRLADKFSGELWYRTDREEFALVADPAHWAGYDKILAFDGFGQECARFDEYGTCVDLRKFDRGQVHPQKTGGVFLGSLTYGYPEVTRNGEKIPITFFASTPVFEFRNAFHYWVPDDGLVRINNAALVSFNFKALVKAASEDGIYTARVQYDQNNDLDYTPSYHKGELVIKLDFDKICNGDDNSGMGECDQIRKLVSDLKWALELRDIYRDVLPDASNQSELEARVLERLRLNHPDMTDEDSAWLLKNSGQTDPKTLEITVPDLCNRCTAKPLCSWQTEAIRIHEKTHVAYLVANPQDRKTLITESGTAVDANKVDRDKARITSQMEYRAYNERAKYLLELIEQQINSTAGCPFSLEFYDEIEKLTKAIDLDVTFTAPPPNKGQHP